MWVHDTNNNGIFRDMVLSMLFFIGYRVMKGILPFWGEEDTGLLEICSYVVNL